MKNHKLNNLRELSTEEQLQLNGGVTSNGCNCNVTCNCSDESPKKTVDDAAKAVGNELKKKIENG